MLTHRIVSHLQELKKTVALAGHWKRSTTYNIFNVVIQFAGPGDSICGNLNPGELRLTFQLKHSGNVFFFLSVLKLN